MLLNRDLICERLGGCTWRTALSRLHILGLEPRKVGREYYLVEEDLEQAVSGKKEPQPEGRPNWEALNQVRKQGRSKKDKAT